jgi:chlorobactene glucosyltransferase
VSPSLWWLAALPWIVLPLVTLARAAWSRTLSEVPDEPPGDAPLLSVIIPARNEARNIEACARSVLASSYPRLEVIVVDDRSEDGTGAIARRLTSEDSRLRVVDGLPLPDGWFGKQWACATGARAARGEWLVFTDADTRHASDLLTRALNVARSRRADLVTVAGRQELGTFWEKVIQPQIFTLLLARYGGTEWVNRSPLVSDKIANGQFLMVTRHAYDALGGHEAVRDNVAEDLALAQRWFAARRNTVLVLGLDQLSTRMYASFAEIVRGWMKNIFAGGRHSMPGGRIGRLFAPLFVLFGPLLVLMPVVALIAALLGAGPPALLRAAAVATGAELLWWAAVYRGFDKLSPLWALTFPLGGLVLLYIVLRALGRGSRVEWKGREYRAA